MPLSVGDKLGPYDILASVGAGGMGDVYKGRDLGQPGDFADHHGIADRGGNDIGDGRIHVSGAGAW